MLVSVLKTIISFVHRRELISAAQLESAVEELVARVRDSAIDARTLQEVDAQVRQHVAYNWLPQQIGNVFSVCSTPLVTMNRGNTQRGFPDFRDSYL